jgi:hypothetical protein
MEMDGGEQFLAVLFTILGGVWLVPYSLRVLVFTSLARPFETRITLFLTQPVCLIVLWLFIATEAASEVRNTVGYQWLFVTATAVAFGVATTGLSVLGLDPVADVLERHNHAALIAIAGLWVAVTVCSAGANLGEGDTVFTTLIPLALSVIILLAFTLVYAAATSGFSAIAIAHNTFAGIRLASFLIAASFVLARAGSGDWVSLSATLADFSKALPPLAALLAVAIAVERYAARRNAMAIWR